MISAFVRLLAFFAVGLVLVGCTTPPPKRSTCGGSQCYIQITPLSRVLTDFNDPNESFSNLYTRVLINSQYRPRAGEEGKKTVVDNQGTVQYDYDYNSRSWLARVLWGTHYGINLSAYISVGAFQATVPLVSIDHVSNRNDGERFLRVVTHTAHNFPLILVRGDGSNAIASIRFAVKATDDVQSGVATAVIQTAEALTKALSIEAPVVTSLSATGVKDKAAALDKAINSVMSKQLDEQQLVENDVRRWAGGAKIQFRVPSPDHETQWDQEFNTVGVWTVVFEDPRPSIFADVQICHPGDTTQAADEAQGKPGYCARSVKAAIAAAQRIAATRPEQVLAFKLVDGTQTLGTVSSYLKQQAWWDTSQKAFSAIAANAQPDADLVRGFCRSLKETVATLGLNDVDAGIIAAAVRERSQLPGKVTAVMPNYVECGYAPERPDLALLAPN